MWQLFRVTDQNSFMDDTMCTNRDIVVNIDCIKEVGNFTVDQPSCPLNIGTCNTISAPDNFARVYSGNHPTHYPRGFARNRTVGIRIL